MKTPTRQLSKFSIKTGITKGERMVPTFDPPLKIPTANARSLLGNHSATALMADEKFPD